MVRKRQRVRFDLRSERWQAFRVHPSPGERKTSFHVEQRDAWQWLLGFSDKPEIDDIPPEFKDLVAKDTDAVAEEVQTPAPKLRRIASDAPSGEKEIQKVPAEASTPGKGQPAQPLELAEQPPATETAAPFVDLAIADGVVQFEDVTAGALTVDGGEVPAAIAGEMSEFGEMPRSQESAQPALSDHEIGELGDAAAEVDRHTGGGGDAGEMSESGHAAAPLDPAEAIADQPSNTAADVAAPKVSLTCQQRARMKKLVEKTMSSKGNKTRKAWSFATECCICTKKKHVVKWVMKDNGVVTGSWCYQCNRAALRLKCTKNAAVLRDMPELKSVLQAKRAELAQSMELYSEDSCNCRICVPRPRKQDVDDSADKGQELPHPWSTLQMVWKSKTRLYRKTSFNEYVLTI